MHPLVHSPFQALTSAFWWVSVIAAYQTIRLYHWFLIKFRFLFHPSRVYTTVRYILLYGDHTEVQAIVPRDLPANVIIVEDIQQHTVTGAIKRASIIRPNNPEMPFAPCLPPWWFIGAKLRSGEEVCMTDLMAQYIVSGNVITPRFLSALAPDISQNGGLVRWFYIHPTSFEDTEIPAEGITIHPDVLRPEPIRIPPAIPEVDVEESDGDLPHEE
jgi:hypothetical protein